MSRLPVLSGREIIKILARQGFGIVGQKGSHIRLKKVTPGRIYIVIVPDHREIPVGTLKSIIRQAGLSEDDFRDG